MICILAHDCARSILAIFLPHSILIKQHNQFKYYLIRQCFAALHYKSFPTLDTSSQHPSTPKPASPAAMFEQTARGCVISKN
jgi:hypothetical protein